MGRRRRFTPDNVLRAQAAYRARQCELKQRESPKDEHAARCDRAVDSLCVVRGDGLLPLGIGDGSRVFPVEGPVVVHGNISLGCHDGNGRTVTSSDFSRYDVSACDTYDSVFDLLFLYNTTYGG